MDDMDDAEEANEEDLIELNDDFAQVKVLVKHIQEKLNEFTLSVDDSTVEGSKYINYCAKQLPQSDLALAKRFIQFTKDTPAL